MAVRFFRVFKTLPYRAGREPITNLYMYDNFSEGGAGSDFPGEITAFTDKLVAEERKIHTSAVSFYRVESGLVRPPRGSERYPVPGIVDYVKEISPTLPGTYLDGSPMRQPEDCILVQRRISNRGWLRKYYHVCGAATAASGGVYNWKWGSGPIATALNVLVTLDEIALIVPTAPTHRLTNSRGHRPGDTGGVSGPWKASDTIIYHELKY